MNKLFCIVVIFAVFITSLMLVKTFIDINSLPKNTFVLNDNVDIPSKDALNRLQGGLQIKTISNPIYNQTKFTDFDDFIHYLQSTYPLIFSKCDVEYINNYNVVIKYKGINEALKPNLLTAHYDVVSVKDEAKWKHPPFSGYYDEENIYSRGTIDDKGSVFAILEALNSLLKEDFHPQADLYVAFSHTEETGSGEGAMQIIEYFREKNIKFSTVVDEGGRIVNKNGQYFAFVGTAEKGRLLTKITVFGKGGHASSPSNNQATKKLAKLMLAANSNKMSSHISKEIEEYYKQTYNSYGFLTRFLISNRKLLRPFFIWKLSRNNEDNARIRSTLAVTIIEASNVQNAVSDDASMLIDSRILPGQSTDDVKLFINKLIKKTIPDETVKIEYLTFMEPSISSNIYSEEYKKLVKNIQQLYPDIIVAPYLTLGATDARDYAEISDNTYRFLPCVLTPEQAGLMHSDNEYISVKNWGRMIDFYKEYIMDR